MATRRVWIYFGICRSGEGGGINAIDDPQTNLQLSELVKSHFPASVIIARACDVDRYIRLRCAGGDVRNVKTFRRRQKWRQALKRQLMNSSFSATDRFGFNTRMVEDIRLGRNDPYSAPLWHAMKRDQSEAKLLPRTGSVRR